MIPRKGNQKERRAAGLDLLAGRLKGNVVR
jgi:hypothetical protein